MDILIEDPLPFPLLGSKEDGEVFEYLFFARKDAFIQIGIFDWMVKRTPLFLNEKVDLYLPSNILSTTWQHHFAGTVQSLERDEERQGDLYQIALASLPTASAAPSESQNEISAFDPIAQLLKLIKDSMLLKQGIMIYLRHLTPYFERITQFEPKNYQQFKKVFLADLERHITQNKKQLEELYTTIKTSLKQVEEIPQHLNLEDLREIMESEISLPIFNVAFAKHPSKMNFFEHFQHHHEFYSLYLHAIKAVEKRLYFNYNQIVLIYLNSI